MSGAARHRRDLVCEAAACGVEAARGVTFLCHTARVHGTEVMLASVGNMGADDRAVLVAQRADEVETRVVLDARNRDRTALIADEADDLRALLAADERPSGRLGSCFCLLEEGVHEADEGERDLPDEAASPKKERCDGQRNDPV